jgi:hypothetical protein
MSSFIGIVVNLWECLVDIGECVRIHKRKEEDSKAQASKAKAKQSKAKAKPSQTSKGSDDLLPRDEEPHPVPASRHW